MFLKRLWFKWLPWRYLISRMARSHGFVDPVAVVAHLERFTQPSEVAAPIELLRAGVVFHARGLVNTRAIQNNLDWVWPFWVERQFDPCDVAFLPRAFSITHVNLTHRNWTAVGLPDCDAYPVIDPRGLVTPRFDGCSLDFWVVPRGDPPLLPSRALEARQRLLLEPQPLVETWITGPGASVRTRVDAVEEEGLWCRITAKAEAQRPGWLVVALRPANPEGVSFIHHIERNGSELCVDDELTVRFGRPPERVCMSSYELGDVFHQLPGKDCRSTTCDVGLATAAALFPLQESDSLDVRVPLFPERKRSRKQAPRSWGSELEGTATFDAPDPWLRFLFDAAVRNLVLHSPGDVYPGPYTYRRFWYRDAAFIVEGMLAAGLIDRARRTLSGFPRRQDRSGFFHSQAGEWDSNGEVLWILDRFRRLAGEPLPPALIEAMARGARWILRKRLPDSLGAPHAGLLPAGFSAEHLGPNDYYYWDDFWSAGGLHAAASSLGEARRSTEADAAREGAEALMAAVERSLETALPRTGGAIPASPYRRMDAGAVGSLAASYPLRLWSPQDARVLGTAQYLLKHCTVRGGFFQQMIHSGVNAYLTLHLAQVLLRAGDARFWTLLQAVADLASPTGQWPEAIHPRTGGGCMGDGQHIWAAAEWVLIIRSLFVREEGQGLVMGSGLPAEWIRSDTPLRFGPTPTPWGPVQVDVHRRGSEIEVEWDGRWRAEAPGVEIRLSGCRPLVVPGTRRSARVPLVSP